MIITKQDVSRILKTGNKEEIQFALRVYFKNKVKQIRESEDPIVSKQLDITEQAKKIFAIEK